MSINVNDKNLGHATAYAYYKAGGGTMTEAEFTEFMADFGTASQTAVEAAQAALASKNAAQTAATTATNKATEATTAATTATNKAAEAQADADAAALDASQALSAASTATTKATEATTAAATAVSAKDDAVAANTAAQSAKTAAQTAQTGAETAAASVQSSAAQIATNTEDIAQLKSEITANVTLTWTQGKFMNYEGSVLDSSVFALSDPIIVAPKTTIRVVTEILGTATICVKNTNDTVVQFITGTNGVKPYDITLADGAYKLYISCYAANVSKASVMPLYVSDSLTDFINANGSDITRAVKTTEVIDGYLLTRSGSIAASNQWEMTDYIPVYPSNSLTVVCYIYGNGAVVFYDADKNVLFGIDGNNASDYGTTASNTTFKTVNISDASNIAFVRFSVWKNYKRATGCSASYVATWKDHAEKLLGDNGETYADKKVLVIGDSISADAYGNYKKWVTNLIDEGKFKQTNVTNSSQHATGFVATSNGSYPNFVTRMEAIADKSTYDLVVVFGGINDFIQNVPLGGESGETDKTVYFKPAVDYFFDYIVNNFTQARICVLLPLRNYNVYPNTAGNKQEVYSQYIHDVAKSYCLPVLNLTEESGFCPFIDSFKQMWTLIPSGYTAPDGTHPNAEYEKKYLAPMIWKFISGLIE